MSQKKELKIISSTNVEVREINWLWYPFIPRGKVTILQGDPGEGKSTFMLTLAAYLTRGEALPFTDCGEPPDPITVLYQSTEDDYDAEPLRLPARWRLNLSGPRPPPTLQE